MTQNDKDNKVTSAETAPDEFQMEQEIVCSAEFNCIDPEERD
ncbi:MAG: hypothetical protein WC292_04515 [Clostridia bacterium]